MKTITMLALLTACTCTSNIGISFDQASADEPETAALRTSSLVVDGTTQMGSASTGTVLSVQSANTIASPTPLEVNPGGLQNSWDISPTPIGTNGDSRLTLFGNVQTVYPNTNYDGFEFWIRAGSAGEQGIILKPNGISFFDPDYWAQRARILAIGHPNAEYELDVRDPGNTHTSTTDCRNDGVYNACRVGSFDGSSHFQTGSAPAAYEAVHAYALGDRTTGTGALTNFGLRVSAANGQTNYGIYQEALGDNVFCAGGAACTTTFKGSTNTTAFEGIISTGVGGSTFSALGGLGFNALFGTINDGSYFVNGALNYGWNVNANDHLVLNHSGYLGGATQFRDLFVYDGKQTKAAAFTGSNHWLGLYTPAAVLGIVFRPETLTSVSAGTIQNGSTNTEGTITAVGATSTTVTFAGGGFATTSRCVAQPLGTTPQFITVTNSATAPVFRCYAATTGSAANCVDFNYWCPGQ